jgi:hypothetical protein
MQSKGLEHVDSFYGIHAPSAALTGPAISYQSIEQRGFMGTELAQGPL